MIEIDKNHDIPIYSPVCTLCNNLTDVDKRVCKAFRKGIPKKIWMGENNHTKPYPGDNGIQFEKR